MPHISYTILLHVQKLYRFVFKENIIFCVISMPKLSRVRRTTFCHSKDEGVNIKLAFCCPVL